MKKSILFVLVLFAFLMAACAPEISQNAPPPPPVDSPAGEKYYCTSPESDNGNSWLSGAKICYDTQAYRLDVQVLGDLSSNQTTNGSISGSSIGGYGSVSGRIWTEGKGILPVQIISMNPAPDTSWGNWLDLSLPYLLKTTDLGFMGVPAGAKVTVICNHDVEVLSPVFNGQTFTQNRVTHELDDCRLVTKNYIPAQ